MEVLARLLERGDEDVVAVVRGPKPGTRLRAALDRAGVPGHQRPRVGLLAADLTEELPRIAGITTVVHCAASVSFGLELDEARRINVAGTRNAMRAAQRVGARYVHVSTAFV